MATKKQQPIPDDINVQPDGTLDIRIKGIDPTLAEQTPVPKDVTVPELSIGTTVRIVLNNGSEQRGIVTYIDDNILSVTRARQTIVIGRPSVSYYVFLRVPYESVEESLGLKEGDTYALTTVGNYITYFKYKSLENDGIHGRRGMEPFLVPYNNILTISKS